MNSDNLNLISNACSISIKDTLKKHYIKHSRGYTADYFKDSKNITYGAYLEDNLLEIINEAVVAAVLSYHDILSSLLQNEGIDLESNTNKSDFNM